METSLASTLKATREERGLSLMDAAHATRIPVPRLRQLEEGNLAAFGNMAYARGFIRIYSDYLGVDATKFVKELPEPIFGGAQDYRYLTESYGPWIDKRVRSSSYGQSDPSSAPARGVYALVLFLVLGVCSAVLAHNFLFPKQAATLMLKPSVALPGTVSISRPASSAVKVSTAAKEVPPVVKPFTPSPAALVAPQPLSVPAAPGRMITLATVDAETPDEIRRPAEIGHPHPGQAGSPATASTSPR